MTLDDRTWLTVPDLAERLGLSPSRVRRLIEDRHLVALRRDGVLSVPEVFLDDEGPLRELRGTIILLGDSGFSDDEAVQWLLEPDDSLGIAAPDPATVIVTLEHPAPYLPELLTQSAALPLPPAALKNGVHTNAYISDGPYLLKSWVPNDRITLIKNPRF